MRYFYRDSTFPGEWKEITQEKALLLVSKTYLDPGDVRKAILDGKPVACFVMGDGCYGQIKAE